MPDCWIETPRPGAAGPLGRVVRRILGRRTPILVLILALGLTTGCGLWGGPSVLDLDGEQDFRQELVVGQELVLDVRDPQPGGYRLAGTAFDPVVVRFSSYEVEPGRGGDPARLRFGFTALTPGDTLVEIRVKPTGSPDAIPEVYKRVLVSVSAD